MDYKKVRCAACGHQFEIASHISNFGCNECGHIQLADSSIKPTEHREDINTRDELLHPKVVGAVNEDRIGEAEQYCLQAEFILHSLQANVSVYGSNSGWSGAQPADVDLALKYINRSLEIWPDNPKYLNLKALFLMEGKGDRAGGLELLERAAKLSPDDITIQDNLQKSKTDQCFIATATYGSIDEWQVFEFRRWRETRLRNTFLGDRFIEYYYRFSPPVAGWLASRPRAKRTVRWLLTPWASRLRVLRQEFQRHNTD